MTQYVSIRTIDDYYSHIQEPIKNFTIINGIPIEYEISYLFCEKYSISERQLSRYREKIDKTEGLEAGVYYSISAGKVFYSTRILDFRKYKKEDNITQNRHTYKIDHTICELVGERSEVFQLIELFHWDYACGSRYKKIIGVSDCVEKMEELFSALNKEFTNCKVTMFYTTENDEDDINLLHNHFALSVKGHNIKNVKKRISSLIRKHTGTSVPYAEEFRKARTNFLLYMIKDIKLYPDGWAVMSNCQHVINSLTPNSVRNGYLSQNQPVLGAGEYRQSLAA